MRPIRHRWGRFFTALAVLCLVLLGPCFAPFAQAKAAHYAADACMELPGEPAWSARERWVWQRVCSGRPADLRGEHPGPGRELGSAFLETIMATEPYRSAVHQAVRIEGAHFSAKLDFDDSRLDNQLSLIGCQFDADVSLQRAETKRLSFSQSHFSRALILARAIITGSLIMKNTKTQGEVLLAFATVSGGLTLIDATASNLNAAGVSVDQAVLVQSGRFKGINLQSAQVGSLYLDGDLGNIDAPFLEVSKSVDISDVKADTLKLLGADIKGMLSVMRSSFGKLDFSKSSITGDALLTNGVTVAGDLDADGTTVGGAFMLTDSTVTGATSLTYFVADSVTISAGSLRMVDLSAAKINGDLQLIAGAKPLWTDGGRLVLRNASARAVEDRSANCPDYGTPRCRDPLPADLDINGFTYQHLGGLAVDDNRLPAGHGQPRRPLTGASLREHWERWLTRQTDFSPQAYDQLATALRGMTYAADATAVQFDAKDRERRAAPAWSLEWLLLFLDRWLIGYGYYPYWAGSWALVLLLIGTVAYVLAARAQLVTGQPTELVRGEPVALTGLVYSFDALIPLVTLRKSDNGVMIRGLPGYYFLFHTLAGWLLATFLAVGIAGLTK